MPILRSTPARMTEMGVGASTCASGNQVWNGNIGIFTANPMKSATQATRMKLRPITAGAEAKPPLRPHSAILSKLKLCIIWPSTGTVGPLK